MSDTRPPGVGRSEKEEAVPDEDGRGRPKWPTSEPTADELIRYAAGWAVWHGGAAWGFVDHGAFDHDQSETYLRYDRESRAMIHNHDVVLLLKALQEVDPDAADKAAANVWRAADAGDSYGEWTWQWAHELGMDADALYANGKAAAAEQLGRSHA